MLIDKKTKQKNISYILFYLLGRKNIHCGPHAARGPCV